MDKLLEYLEQFKYINSGYMNQFRMKPNELKFNDVDVDVFNTVLDLLEESDLNMIQRKDKTGSIALGKAKYNNCYAWDLERRRTGLRITVIIGVKQWVFKIGAFSSKDEKPGIYPSQAFYIFKNKCLDYGIDLDKYKITNGKEIKEQIESPLITMFNHMDKTDPGLDNVHHIDFHSSYPAGLANTHPEFKQVLEEIYNKRNDPQFTIINKAILVDSIGWMQSYKPERNRFAEWAHLSRDAIADNNKRIIELTVRLRSSGRKILGYNTDGIWYRGEIYHGKGEGKNLGDWSNDHINCLFRSKSDGAYEFIENGKYNVVVRGLTTYDMIEPNRDKWKWGDMYKGTNINYHFDKITRRIVKDEIQA